jgi:phospholipid/cholesterol/gamma-HCH transport system ATP-binding protein
VTVEPRPAISVRDLVVSLGGRDVLNGLSITVRRGEILGVVSASGGGKSVLLRTILQLLPKTSGMIEVLGQNMEDLSPEEQSGIGRRLGVLFQHGALFSALTALQNVQFPMREYLKIPQDLMDEIALAKLEMVGLKRSDAGKMPSELSGGMIKRVALARALALEPDIVFLDEPTSGLDPISAEEFDRLIRTLQQTLGLTVYMNTHDLDSLVTVCDRIAALADGKVVALGAIAEVRQCDHPWVRAYFAGERAMTVSGGAGRKKTMGEMHGNAG